MSDSAVWPVLHYDDTRAALRFLVDVLGFEQHVAVCDEGGELVHAEVRWPEGGMVVFGSTTHKDSVHGRMPAGVNAVYIATEEVDAMYERARHAGATVAEQPQEARLGSGERSYLVTIEDPERNLWTFGTYRGTRRS
ncbi:VOC family protein [Sciscionella sediminilitoris]|uniref:VOC family protein n=1 Tax=Sciscionella sediminilitoris TaxID=1445613 RepID=UPI0004DED513|nr:VOC family protein [Sciscionella sp. SE31]